MHAQPRLFAEIDPVYGVELEATLDIDVRAFIAHHPDRPDRKQHADELRIAAQVHALQPAANSRIPDLVQFAVADNAAKPRESVSEQLIDPVIELPVHIRHAIGVGLLRILDAFLDLGFHEWCGEQLLRGCAFALGTDRVETLKDLSRQQVRVPQDIGSCLLLPPHVVRDRPGQEPFPESVKLVTIMQRQPAYGAVQRRTVEP